MNPDASTPARREAKTVLRAAMRAKLHALTPEDRAAASLVICHQAAALTAFRQAKTVALFAPLSSEPDIAPLIEEAWAEKKRVVLPLLGQREKAPWLHWHLVADWTDLTVTGPFGLREPDPKRCTLIGGGEIECVFVPGLAFDSDGHRLGRGGGYYDSFLGAVPHAPAIGLFFERQRVVAVPCEDHDARLARVITEGKG
jgi:5-formyltetrahydrofolate cyclo-ligase